MEYPVITIVTPNYNMGAYLERTIRSVVEQGYPNLEYIVIDGGSQDESLKIIKAYADSISYYVTEHDDGMYHALNKGFGKSTGEIMGWLNSDDILQPGALDKLARLFDRHKHVRWIQGRPNAIDLADSIVYTRQPVSNKYHFYLQDYLRDANCYIMQEGTFWRRSLWVEAGSHLSTSYKLAGDFELWLRFFRYATLFNTTELLGSFRNRPGQKSTDRDLYNREANTIVKKEMQRMSTRQRLAIAGLRQLRRSRRLSERVYEIVTNRFFERHFVSL